MEVFRHREGNNGSRRHNQQRAEPVFKSKPSGSWPHAFNHLFLLPTVLSAPGWWQLVPPQPPLPFLYSCSHSLCGFISQISLPIPPPPLSFPAPPSDGCLPSSQDQRAANLLRTFPLTLSNVILQRCQRSSSIQPCRLVPCELACLLYQATCYWKAELCLPGASLCLKYIKGGLNSLSDHIPSQFPYFCSGNYHLSFLPASEILLHP